MTEHAVHPAWVPDAPLAPPSSNGGLLDVFRRRYLLRLLVKRELSARYQGSFLGLLWSYINPLSQFFIYWVVMGYILGLHKESMNQKDVVTADLETLNLASAGAIALLPQSTLKLEPLLQSSGNSALASTATVRAATSDPGLLARDFKPDGGGPYVLAGRLTGTLKTAFPERSGPKHLAVAKKPVNILVIADSDLLSDRMWVQAQDFLGQQILNPFANNADFIYNAVDNLSGDDDLIQVRTRPTSGRPFERVEGVKRAAEVRYQDKARQLQQQLDALEQKLAGLQPTTADGKAQALSRQQQAQLQQYQREKLRTRKELREVQRQLNADIEAMGARLKKLDILAMPVLVLLVTVLVALRRRWRRAER